MLRADELLSHLKADHTLFNQETKPTFTHVTLDSRTVQPGSLFLAIQGTHTNGEDFIPSAIQKGAAGIVCTKETAQSLAPKNPHVYFIGTAQGREITSEISKAFFPKHPQTMVAVTGTNGKTSTVEFTRQLWSKLGFSAASLGTLGVLSPALKKSKHLTTPEAPYLHETLHQMAEEGLTHVAMEASSHGLHQHRMDQVPLKAAGFTNLTPEHLDYHQSMEAYLQAKADLFQRILPKEGWCVLNADIPQFEILKEVAGPHPLLSYGYGGRDIQIQSVTPHNTGQIASLLIQGEPFEISLPLIGEFQLYNALCALGLVIACSPDYREAAIGHMNTLDPIPGRLEHIGSTPHKAAIYIDYAHTADGMETLLKSLRDHTKNHIHIVFGGGGDRDPGTRKPRGEVAQNLADAVYISDDNPRFEDPQKIRAQILEGCPKAQEVPDRREAIFKAIQSLQEGDSLVVAGKGIEEGQDVQGIVHPFSDKQTIIEALKTL